MLLNKGPIPQSMGINPQTTTQYSKPIRNFLTSPSTIAKGFGRLGGVLSGLVHSNDAVAAEKPGFFDQLQQQGIAQPHEQQQLMQGMLKNEPFENDPHYGDSDDGGYAGHPGTPGVGEPGYGGSSRSGGSSYGGSNRSGSGSNGRMTWRDILIIQDPVRQKELLDRYNNGATNTNRGNHSQFDYQD